MKDARKINKKFSQYLYILDYMKDAPKIKDKFS